jgi:hypothetical protein
VGVVASAASRNARDKAVAWAKASADGWSARLSLGRQATATAKAAAVAMQSQHDRLDREKRRG